MFPIKKIYKDIFSTILRFPMPIMAGMLAFIFFFIEIHFSNKDSSFTKNYIFIKIALECVGAISYLIAVDIFVESKNLEFSKRLGLYILGFCIMGMHYYSVTPGMFDNESVFISRYLIFITCFHLLVSFLAFYHKNEIQNFWQYNNFLFVKFFTSLLYSITLYAGLASALLAIDKLFHVALSFKLYADLGLFIFLVINTIIFLYFLPKSYQVFIPVQKFKPSIRIFVQYILIPILLIYIIILYLYLFRIIIYNHIPSGWVCIPILIFSIVGILAYLLIYPIRLDAKHKIIQFYAKYFFYILLPLLSLYFVAIVQRILPYGITEDRYLVLVLGIWLVIISVYIIVSKKDNIVVIPVSLFLLLFISAIGPWGMFQLSVQNQVRRLEFLLKKNHLLVNNKLVSPSEKNNISEANANSIRSILNYLNKRGEISQIHTWLNEEDQITLNNAIKNNELSGVNAIFSNLKISKNIIHYYYTFLPELNFLSEKNISIEKFSNIITFEKREAYNPNQYGADVKDSLLFIFKNKDTLLKFNASSMRNILLQQSEKIDSIEEANIPFNTQVQLVSVEQFKTYKIPNDSLIFSAEKYKIIFNEIMIDQYDTTENVMQIKGILLY